MKKPNYKFERQQKDKSKKKKQELKRQKKLERSGNAPEPASGQDYEGQGPPPNLAD